MRPGLLVFGIVLLVLAVVLAFVTPILFIGVGITGVGMVIGGFTGKRTFECIKCKRRFETKDNMQKSIITCPSCSEKYILKDNSIYRISALEENISRQEKRECPECESRMRISIPRDRWECMECGFIASA